MLNLTRIEEKSRPRKNERENQTRIIALERKFRKTF